MKQKTSRLGVGHLGAESPADLVAHAGVAVLQVVGLGIGRPPEPVQVARHGTGGVDDDVMVAGDGVHDPDRFGLGQVGAFCTSTIRSTSSRHWSAAFSTSDR